MSVNGRAHQSALTTRNVGLDGLRGFAVVVVILFHLRLDGPSDGLPTGGFLGVSLFFTLSGYLITHILLDEFRRDGRISLRAFWARRLRRLMPGALVALFLVTIVALASEVFRSSSTRGDLWSALGYVANWRFMTAETTYADLFTAAPSPVLHFWSLAIEEQFYFIFPVVLVVLVHSRRWVLPVGLGAVWLASVAGSFLGSSDNTVYYGTHTRAAELLTGSLVALVAPMSMLSSRNAAGATSRGSRIFEALLRSSTLLAVVGFVILVYAVDISDRWLYHGGFAAVSFVSVLLVVGVQKRGPLQWIAERSVLVAAGRVSYGLYLFHWPIFLLVNETRTGFDGWLLHGVRLGVTVLVSVVVHRLIENPIRHRRRLVRRGRGVSAFLVSVIVVAVGIGFIPQTDRAALAGLEAPDEVVDFGDRDVVPTLRVAVLGSQPAAVIDVRRALGGRGVVVDAVDPRCPASPTSDSASRCLPLDETLESLETESPVDIVVVGFGDRDRQLVVEEMGRTGLDIFEQAGKIIDDVVTGLAGRQLMFLDYGIRDPLHGELDDAGLESTAITTLQRPADIALRDEFSVIIEMVEGTDHRQRIMVIGDSSSFGVSAAIDAVAGDWYDVLWAGRRNCPLVEVQRLRWWEGVEFDMEPCPTLNPEWRDLIDSFAPQAIVIVVTIPEQAEQMYPGDPTWHLVGDAAFTATHEAFMTEFMALLDERGIELVIFSSPRIHGGALGGAPFSQDDRVSAWNDQLAKWLATWPRITVIDWAGILERAESPPGSLRSDGVHLEQADLNRLIASEVLPVLDVAVRSPES